MTKKVLSYLLTAAMVLSVISIMPLTTSAESGGATIDVSDTTTTSGDGWTYNGAGVFTIDGTTPVTITGETTTSRVVVSGDASITLDNATIDITSGGAPIDCGNKTVTFTLVGENVMSTTVADVAGLQANGGHIIINGNDTDSLTASATVAFGAGIGSGWGWPSTVTINGGVINAIGGSSGSGIGPGQNDISTITINGGTVTAESGRFGFGWTNSTITIKGGSVKGTMAVTPTNGTNPVYLNTLTVGDYTEDETDNKLITAGTINGVAMETVAPPVSGGYGIKDVKTDEDGIVYFYLPASGGSGANSELVTVKAGSTQYAKNYARTSAGNTEILSFYMPTVIVPATISTNTTWTAGNVYVINGTYNTTVAAGAKLTIEPGAIVKFRDGYSYLYINGELDARGTSESPIYFTSYKDDTVGGDTNGDGDKTSPDVGDWHNISIGRDNAATVIMNYCVVRYGSGNYYAGTNDAMIHVSNNSDVTITNSEITNSRTTGIKFNENFTKSPVLSNNTISKNATNGIYVNNSNPTITGNIISNNGQYGILVGASSTVTNIIVPAAISKNTFLSNTSGNIYLGTNAAGTPIKADNVNIGGIIVNTGINTDTVWTAGNVYVIPGDVAISSAAKLTVESGTVIKFQIGGNSRFLVSGELDARGTSEKPIYFTSIRDDAAGGDTNGDATLPAAGDWNYLTLGRDAAATVNMDYCVIRYGGGNWGGWTNDSMMQIANNSAVTISNSEISNSIKAGIKIDTVGGGVAITDCVIENNATGQVIGTGAADADFSGTPIETLAATADEGTAQGSMKVTATAGSGNRLVVFVSATPIATPDILSAAPTGTGVTDPYTSGADISGAAGKYIGVYAVNSNNKVVKFALTYNFVEPTYSIAGIDEPDGDNVSVCVEVTGTIPTPAPKLIVVTYNGGKMVEMATADVTYSAIDEHGRITVPINLSGATRVRAFIWNSLTNMQPLCNFEEIPLTQQP